jgi:uncharacterized phage protein (TIGR01671 family)
MREIKFKAWIMPYEMMVEVQRINFDVQTIEVKIGEGDLYEFNFEEIELMRNSGTKDSNGNYIYEHDIIKWYNQETDCSDIGGVFYNDGMFIVRNKFGSVSLREYNTLTEEVETIEKIGNIHEDSQLWGEICG